jgi:Skp family chaperone for outer membrane proteins
MRYLFAFATVAALMMAVVSSAQAPKAQSPPVSPGDKCLADLPQWQTYSAALKNSRDGLEQEVAMLRARVADLEKKLAEKKAP